MLLLCSIISFDWLDSATFSYLFSLCPSLSFFRSFFLLQSQKIYIKTIVAYYISNRSIRLNSNLINRGAIMSLVVSAKEQISKVTDASLREKFEDALRQSYVWNGISNDKPPLSAESIVDASGISAEALEGKGILLGKRGIARYASEIERISNRVGHTKKDYKVKV